MDHHAKIAASLARPKEQRALWLVGLMLVAAILVASYVYLRAHFSQLAKDLAAERLTLHHAFLSAELEKYKYLPFVLSKDATIENLLLQHQKNSLTASTQKKVNQRLADFVTQSGAAALYLMDETGLTIASSNFEDQTSFIGNKYAFRPYFQDALQGRQGAFFAVGVTTKTRGMFYSNPVQNNQGTIGVMAVKVDFSPLEKSWQQARERVFVTDERGIIVLSSNEEQLYHSTRPLLPEDLQTIRKQRQFAENDLPLLSHGTRSLEKASEMTLDQTTFIHQTRKMPSQNWTLHYLTPASDVKTRSLSALALEGLILSFGLLALLYWRGTNLKRQSLRAQADAKLQRRLNQRLESEIEERKRTEQELRATQDNLIHASKMASLGHMSATISHEINQHIAAATTFIAGMKKLIHQKRHEEADKTLGRIDGLMKRMTAITKQLKAFSRKAEQHQSPVNILDALTSALSIAEPRLKNLDIHLTIKPFHKPLMVMGDRSQMEQVFLNIIQNAIDAVADKATRKIILSISATDAKASIHIEDSGPGLSDDIQTTLFDPFVTTKPHGDGLGLGLAISTKIIESFGGTLIAQNSQQQKMGALFIIDLPLQTDRQAKIGPQSSHQKKASLI
ncbi:MAG: cache domain-containing protein [Cohaesibacter sp.]|nr:cache domain-containing protein [Cohaesibacter sp.]MCV6601456.1 cache domain-containing protein [Cohaesibacter sp.]